MVIALANQKGGVGKSTHCALFAQYLSEKEKDVHVIDMDNQMSLKNKRKNDVGLYEKRSDEENLYDNPLNYSIRAISPEDILEFLKNTETLKDSIIIIDTPGNIENENVIKTLYLSDYIVIPFSYTELKLDSTAVFIQVMKAFKVKAKLIFMPNDIDRRIKIDSANMVNVIFGKEGVVTPILYHYADIERFSTIEMNKRQRELVLPIYDFMYNYIFI
ncbi:MAG: ParA family protein [Dysgonamonadaceae bacterium]|jgi:chromosome partitioning protein|nr:ParA family protein [Dysgonamonadaceae bacterium]